MTARSTPTWSELSDAPPIPPAPVPLHRHEPEPEIEPEPEQPAPVPRSAPVTRQPPSDPKPATTSATAQRVFQERLAYSPKRDEARSGCWRRSPAPSARAAPTTLAGLAAQLEVM